MEYPKPRCPQCSTPLPLRTITIKAVLCWNCEETINVAAGYRDHLPMPQASFTRAERDFAHRHGVVLDRRYSHIAMTSYLANVCPGCDHMQGDWFIYFDPNRDVLSIERARRETHGPCDKCSAKSCPKHGALHRLRRHRPVSALSQGHRDRGLLRPDGPAVHPPRRLPGKGLLPPHQAGTDRTAQSAAVPNTPRARSPEPALSWTPPPDHGLELQGDRVRLMNAMLDLPKRRPVTERS